jgi:hypothetical protein
MKMLIGLKVFPTVIETFFDRIRSDIVQMDSLLCVVLQLAGSAKTFGNDNSME